MNKEMKLNRNGSIAVAAVLAASLLFPTTLARADESNSTSTDASTAAMSQASTNAGAESAPTALPSDQQVSRRPGILERPGIMDPVRAVRRAKGACLASRLAHAAAVGSPLVLFWSRVNLPPSCEAITYESLTSGDL